METIKPLVVIACPPETGHTIPLLPHSTHLTKQGYSVHFIGSPDFEHAIRQTGATFYPIQNVWNEGEYNEFMTYTDPLEQAVWGIKACFGILVPSAMQILKTVLEDLRAEQHEREVVIVQELGSMGSWPFVLGAPLPKGYTKYPKVITFSTTPLTVSSIDTAPFGPGLPPDSSEEGRVRNRALYKEMAWMGRDMFEHANAFFKQLGATTRAKGGILDFWNTLSDITVLPCSRSLEYPRSDLSPKIHFIGGTPRKVLDPAMALPDWWGDLMTAKNEQTAKKVIPVTQGTFMRDTSMLVMPTIEALAGRKDYLVIVIVGRKGTKLEDVAHPLPSNARVIDYLPYHAILPYADAFVFNAGHGGSMQSIMHGVPMVLAGVENDKAEVAMRGAWAGVGINLRTSRPSLQAIQDAADKVITNDSFKARCLELQRKNEELNPLSRLERFISEMR